jgi:GxxExxY protein
MKQKTDESEDGSWDDGVSDGSKAAGGADPLSHAVIGCAYAVANELGPGFLEKNYENAMMIELKDRGLKAEQQVALRVLYKGQDVGHYIADILVEGSLLLELKSIEALKKSHAAVVINYLKATELKTGLLINFGPPRIQVTRVVNQEK